MGNPHIYVFINYLLIRREVNNIKNLKSVTQTFLKVMREKSVTWLYRRPKVLDFDQMPEDVFQELSRTIVDFPEESQYDLYFEDIEIDF